MDLITIDGGGVRTLFPVLGTQTSEALRGRLRSLATSLVDRLSPAVSMLTQALREQDLDGHCYALVWAVYPPRPESAGTNFVYGAWVTLALVWTEKTHSDLAALIAADGISDFIDRLPSRRPQSPRLIEDRAGRVWRFERPDGRLTIPLVGHGGRLDACAGAIADVAAEAMSSDIVAATYGLVPGADRSVATVIVAHELIWEITEALVAAEVLSQPPVFSSNTRTTSRLRDLLYLDIRRA